jgi:sugar phosphate isomerase/epimerase
MQRVLSTYLFISQKLTPGRLAEIARAGIGAVEIFSVRSHFDYRNPQAVRELGEWFDEHDLSLHALHAPTSRDFAPGRESELLISISDTERLRRLDAVDEVKRALEVSERIPFRFLVQHLAGGREPMDPRKLDAAFNSLEHLIVFAKQRGVTIALENTPGELSSPTSLRHFIEDTRLHDLRLCFDTGHAHLEEGIERSFETMRERVATTHVHDNRGDKDEHLFPYEGTIDWTAALGALRSAPEELPIVLELKEDIAHSQPIEQAAAVFDKFEQALAALREPPAAKKTPDAAKA